VLIGKQAGSTWLYVTPTGIRKILGWLHKRWVAQCAAGHA
jgi:hypothetical protein